MLFSLVKISCFCAKAQLVFHWCLYNKVTYNFIIMYHSTRHCQHTESLNQFNPQRNDCIL